jgi:type I restriction enzyme S subunit
MTEAQLPDEWIELKVGEIANVIAGGTPHTGNLNNFAEPGQGIAWLTPADLSGYKKKYISRGARDLSQEGYDSSSAKLMPKGSLLFSSRAPIGYVAIASNEISTNQGFKSFVFTSQVDSSFAYYYFKNIRDLAEDLGTGTTFKEVSGSKVKTLPFILPPLAEQKVISDKLDTLLVQVENITTQLEHIPDILNNFRQSVLATAVSGKLTKEWRAITETNYDWIKSNLGDIVKIDRGSSPRPIQQYLTDSDDGVNWVKISDAKESDKYITSTKEKITKKGAEKSRHVVPGDFVLSNSMSLGRAYIMKIEGYIHDGWFVLRLPNYLNADFFYYLLSSSQVQNQFTSLAVGGVVKNIRSELVKQTVVQIPPIEEQKEIVRKVEVLFAYADQIEQQVQTALEKVNNQTQSIIAKAFRGELTADWRASHPELISGDNSALALLAKIKAEQENLGKQPKIRKLQTNIEKTMSKQIIKVTDALKLAGKSLSGQELFAAAGYPTDSSTEQLEQFFLDIREALSEKYIVKQNRDSHGQDWFALAG